MIRYLLFSMILLNNSFLALAAEQDLEKYKWKNRILIFNEFSEELKLKITKYSREIQDRDLILLENKNYDDYFAKLIGKDGTTKQIYSKTNFKFEEVFKLIDSMPMRRFELQNTKK